MGWLRAPASPSVRASRPTLRQSSDPADPKWDELVYQVGACGSTFRDIANETSLSLHRLAALNAEVFRSRGRSGVV